MHELEEENYTSDAFDFQTWTYVLKLVFQKKAVVICLIVFNIGMAITDVILPLFNRYAMNTYIIDHKGIEGLPWFIILYVLLILTQCTFIYLFLHCAIRIESGFAAYLRKQCFEKLQQHSFSYFDHHASGWLMARVSSDTARLSETVAWALVDLVWGIFVMIGISVVMLVINWKLACSVFIILPFIWFVSLYFQRHILQAQRFARKENAKITASFAEGINGAQTTKTLAVEDYQFSTFTKQTKDMKTYSMRALYLNAIFQPLIYLFSALVIALLLTVGGKQVMSNQIQFGTLAMFMNYAILFFDPLKQIARVLAELQIAQASAERVVSLLQDPIDIVDTKEVSDYYGTLFDEHKEVFEPMQGDVTFDHVSFGYDPSQIVLDDFNLEVHKGETIAFVGETGSGKSTIVNLLCRFYEPLQGSIQIDGKDYRTRSIGWLHSNIGYVLQSPTLFSGTIKDNIRYGRKDASDEEVIEVCKQLKAHDFIMDLKDGYDTVVGEGGDLLSTGQKQLISFARALFVQPSIVILDEATSSIDTESEQIIQYAMDQLLQHCTSFVVAHRLSTIEKADQIIVMKHGKKIDQGTHEELLQKHGYYYNLYQAQYIKEKQEALWEHTTRKEDAYEAV